MTAPLFLVDAGALEGVDAGATYVLDGPEGRHAATVRRIGPGERVDLPQFGCGLRSLVFAPNSDALAATVQLRVVQGLSQWLAGVVNVVSVVMGAGSNGAVLEPGTIEVTVSYTLVETQTNQAVTVTVS